MFFLHIRYPTGYVFTEGYDTADDRARRVLELAGEPVVLRIEDVSQVSKESFSEV